VAGFPAGSWGVRALLAGGSVVLLAASLYWAKPVLIPIVLAALLTFILAPSVAYLQRLHFGRVPAVVTVVTLTLAALLGVCLVVYTQLGSLAEEIPHHKEQVIQRINDIREASRSSWLDRLGGTIREIADEALRGVPDAPPASGDDPVPVQIVSSRWWTLQSTATPLLELLASAGLVVVLLTFMLIYREDVRNRMIALLSNGDVTTVTRAVDDGVHRLSRYLRMQLVVNVAAGVTVGVGLFFIGVPYAVLWGFMAALLRYVPYVGPWIAGCLPIVYSLAVLPGWTQPVLVLVLVLVMETITNNLLEPWLFGHSIGTSEVALLISAAIWTWLWGPIGLLLSAPLTACLAVLGRHVPPLRALGILLGDQPVMKPHVIIYQRLLARDQDEAAEVVEEYQTKHGLEATFEEVFVPALVLANRGGRNDDLSENDSSYLYQALREILEEAIDTGRAATDAPPSARNKQVRPLALACPARGEPDVLALRMLESLLLRENCRFRVLSHELLAAEILERVQTLGPAVLCILALPPKGLSHTRYLCKRLRAEFPPLKLLVGYLAGAANDVNQDRIRERLQDAGADLVAFTLASTRSLLLTHLDLSPAASSRSLVKSP
jgi:predicted PurR-regulated permease PerM